MPNRPFANESLSRALIFLAFLVIHLHSFSLPPAVSSEGLQPLSLAVTEASRGSLAEHALWHWILQLGSPKYAERQRAILELEQAGPAARPALQASLGLPDLEIRKNASKLLRRGLSDQFDAELLRMHRASQSGHTYSLPGWQIYQGCVGDTEASRALFVAMASRYRRLLCERFQTPVPQGNGESFFQEILNHPVHAAHVRDGDPATWGLLLLNWAALPEDCGNPWYVQRIRSGLCNTRAAVVLRTGPHAAPLRLFVAEFLDRELNAGVQRASLQIALQWECKLQAVRLAKAALDPSHAHSAGNVALALAVLTRLQPETARKTLPDWVQDSRPAQVWQIIATTRKRVQTQVGDVALAMLLTLEGVDPRKIGFEDLEADPLTIYREHSMGFENEHQRTIARQTAMQYIGNHLPSAVQVQN